MRYEIQDFLRIIKHHSKWIIIFVIFSVLITTIVSFWVIPPLYEANTTLLIQPYNPGNQLNYSDLEANQKLVSTYSEILKSKTIANMVISRLNLKTTEKQLLKQIKIEKNSDSLITSINVRDTDPKQAVLIANGFAYSFQENLPNIMKIENISILDKAHIEETPIPVSPKPLFNICIVLLLSLSISLIVAILIDILDKSVKTESDILKIIEAPVLATIHKHSDKTLNKIEPTLIFQEKPKSLLAENFRTLRTNIKYMEVKTKIHSLLITSPLPGEGKSFSIANLAAAISFEDKKVLLMDCDLRNPSLHMFFNVSNKSGLSNVLLKAVELERNLSNTNNTELNTDQIYELLKTIELKRSLFNINKNLDLLPSGPIPPNPAELLSTNHMKLLLEGLKQHYDLVLLDSPPIIPVTDGQLLSSLSDAVILVTKSGTTGCEDFKATKNLLDGVRANIIGTILNFKKNNMKYYSYYYK